MKRINGIIGSSLAGFVALTMAAITSTTTTEAIAFQATGAKVRVAPPTRVRSVSYRHRVPHSATKIPGATLSAHSRIGLSGSWTQDDSHLPHPPDPPHRPTPPHMLPDISVMGEVRVPTDHSLPETKLGAKRLKGPKYFDLKIQHILDDFNRMRNFWEFENPLPPEVDPRKFGIGPVTGDGSCLVESDEFWEKVGEPTGDVRGFAEANNMCDTPGSGTGNPNDGHLTGGNNGGDAGGSGTTDDGGKGGGDDSEPTGGGDDSTATVSGDDGNSSEAEGLMRDDVDNDSNPEGDDPDEMRNAVRNENLNISGLKEEAATGEGSGSGHKVTHGSSPQKTDGSGWFRNHHGADGPTGANAGVEDGGPAEMANPMGVGAAGINLSRGHAMSPTVDGQQSGNGPSGPIGPVATQVQSKALSVNMSGHLTAAMSDPMGSSPMVDGNGDGYHGGPVDPR